MPNPVYPGGVWYGGAHDSYQAGSTGVHAAVCHYTVGRNSLDLCARDGLCQFVISRGGDEPNSPDGRATVWQLAPTDATCYHAGSPFNGYGPGLEVEYHPDYHATMFTDDQLRATGDLVLWLSAEWHIPLVYLDTGGDNAARVWDWNGFLSHRACQSSADWHYDYWDYADWEQMVRGDTEPPKRKRPPMGTVFQSELSAMYVEGGAVFLASPDMTTRAINAGCPLLYVPHEEFMANYARMLGVDQEDAAAAVEAASVDSGRNAADA